MAAGMAMLAHCLQEQRHQLLHRPRLPRRLALDTMRVRVYSQTRCKFETAPPLCLQQRASVRFMAEVDPARILIQSGHPCINHVAEDRGLRLIQTGLGRQSNPSAMEGRGLRPTLRGNSRRQVRVVTEIQLLQLDLCPASIATDMCRNI
jgi:hypothetical protein